MNNSKFLAKKTKEWDCAYLSPDFVPNLRIKDQKGRTRKFHKILWDYIPDSDNEVLKWAGKEISEIANKLKVEIILGMESSGIHYAAIAAIYAKKPFGFVRKSAKDYGLKRIIEGEFGKRKKVLLVDNFVFTGGTLLNCARYIKDSGLKLSGLVSVDYFDNLPKVDGFNDLPFTSLVTNSEKIQALIKLGYFPTKLIPFIEKYIYSPEYYFAPSEIHKDYVKALSQCLGLKKVVWLGNGDNGSESRLIKNVVFDKLNLLKKN